MEAQRALVRLPANIEHSDSELQSRQGILRSELSPSLEHRLQFPAPLSGEAAWTKDSTLQLGRTEQLCHISRVGDSAHPPTPTEGSNTAENQDNACPHRMIFYMKKVCKCTFNL